MCWLWFGCMQIVWETLMLNMCLDILCTEMVIVSLCHILLKNSDHRPLQDPSIMADLCRRWGRKQPFFLSKEIILANSYLLCKGVKIHLLDSCIGHFFCFSVRIEQGNVVSLLKENGTVKGVQYKTRNSLEVTSAYAPLTVVCDGCFSNIRRSLCTSKVTDFMSS